jgi:hypothetical protein
MTFLRHTALALMLTATAYGTTAAKAASEFPFGMEMMLDAAPQPGSKKIPTLEIGDSGEAVLDLWCKSGKGQFSVANDTVVFVPGTMEDRGCSPARAQADDALVATLTDAATWKRQGNFVLFVGAKTIRFRLNTN